MLSFCGINVSKDRLDVMVLPDEVAGLCALQYFVGVNSRSTTHFDLVSCIRQKGAMLKGFS
jgi:hypothetical protein